MRLVVLDVETTGMNKGGDDVTKNHRIIEFAAVEIIDGIITGRYLHHYIRPSPKCLIDPKAFELHGISLSFLKDKKSFKQCAGSIIDFIKDSKIVAHNAPFDIAFLNMEFKRLPKPLQPESLLTVENAIDTLEMARLIFPKMGNKLCDLAERFDIPKPRYHGAFVDAEILSRVYFHLIGIIES